MMDDKIHLQDYLKSLGSEVYPYGNVSHGFRDILSYIAGPSEIRPPNIVMPSFVPAKLFRAVSAAGYIPKFYDIKEECRFDADEIGKLVDEKTTAIFVIHYFGHPADIRSLKKIAVRKNVKLIEDCAHVLIGTTDGERLGSFGDFTIFSPRKMLQLPNGGFLVSRNPLQNFVPSYDRRAATIRSSSTFVGTRAKRLYFKMCRSRDPLHLARLPRIGEFDPTKNAHLSVKRMSQVTSAYSKVVNIRKISEMRRHNYFRLLEGLKGLKSVNPLYHDAPDEWEPYSFPMIVRAGERKALQEMLLGAGISCRTGWPESPFVDGLPGTTFLSEHLIELPVHPLILSSQLDRMVETCNEYERQSLRK